MKDGNYNFYDVEGRPVTDATDVEEIAKNSAAFSIVSHRGIAYYVVSSEDGRTNVLTQVFNYDGIKSGVLRVSGHQERKILDMAGRTN